MLLTPRYVPIMQKLPQHKCFLRVRVGCSTTVSGNKKAIPQQWVQHSSHLSTQNTSFSPFSCCNSQSCEIVTTDEQAALLPQCGSRHNLKGFGHTHKTLDKAFPRPWMLEKHVSITAPSKGATTAVFIANAHWVSHSYRTGWLHQSLLEPSPSPAKTTFVSAH